MSGVSAQLSPRSDSMNLASCSQHHTLQPQTPSANKVHCTLPAFVVAELWLCLQVLTWSRILHGAAVPFSPDQASSHTRWDACRARPAY